MDTTSIEQMIQAGIPDAKVNVTGDDGVHFQASGVSDSFAGKSLLQQHRLVYDALGGRVENQEIHALALTPYPPEAWAKTQP